MTIDYLLRHCEKCYTGRYQAVKETYWQPIVECDKCKERRDRYEVEKDN